MTNSTAKTEPRHTNNQYTGTFYNEDVFWAFAVSKRLLFAFSASDSGFDQIAAGGSQIPNSFFISSTGISHRSSQYTLIRGLELDPHFRAQGTYSRKSLARFSAFSRSGPKIAPSPAIGSPKCTNSNHLSANSDSTLTGRLQSAW
jgi:hypothetical protein